MNTRSALSAEYDSKPRGCNPWAFTRLIAAIATIGVVWLVVLPALARLPRVQARSRLYESRQIEPGAMYYTELEAMPAVLDRLDRFHREQPTAFWQP